MIKKAAVAVPIDEYANFRDSLIAGDLPPQPLEALMTFVQEVRFIIMNPTKAMLTLLTALIQKENLHFKHSLYYLVYPIFSSDYTSSCNQ